jgi:hypothetical protein
VESRELPEPKPLDRASVGAPETAVRYRPRH